jgi:hypothetical protein
MLKSVRYTLLFSRIQGQLHNSEPCVGTTTVRSANTPVYTAHRWHVFIHYFLTVCAMGKKQLRLQNADGDSRAEEILVNELWWQFADI